MTHVLNVAWMSMQTDGRRIVIGALFGEHLGTNRAAGRPRAITGLRCGLCTAPDLFLQAFDA